MDDLQVSDAVRTARPEDIPALVRLCESEHAERGLGAFSQEKVAAVLWRAVDPAVPDVVVGVVGEEVVEGSVGLVIERAWNSSTDLLVCRWNFVLPPYRKSTHLRDLTSFARAVSRAIGLPLYLDAVATPRTEGQVNLYRRQLGEPIAVTWIHEASGGVI